MTVRAVNADPMEGRIARFNDLKGNGTSIMFIDSVLPGHYRTNYSVIGDTASENPDFKPMLTIPHRFQIGMFEAPPGNGPGWHTHTYVELFVPLTGRWRFCYGTNPDDPDDIAGDAVLEPWDVISFPSGLWRRFENVAQTNSWGFAVLDPHDAFTGRDPVWPAWLEALAAERGLRSDEHGRMVKPPNFAELEREVAAKILPTAEEC
ncbi:MAG: cupin domain-containing protein [Candidatus Dormibacteraeota bacterium]|uniref:Cupin domain-containing protein n=1 Tax=Candidatus Dormiibacter inghamiae TaxID=3127013 RepID=A0A934KB66_9BACT|nr:cupin domain-containing protein [Candidatus Dormibacteraeota bacterium]MBJ7606466.1 cupin domain-containing protein [Candidatus Dormibacteraeota bacterium]